MKDIYLLESVQRTFTKKIAGMSNLTYFSRLQALGMESLELRRLRTDVLMVYKIMFGMMRLNGNEFFTLRNQPHLRGHKYVINKQRCCNNRRNNFFSNRIVNLWNNLPSSTTDFTSFRRFNKSLSNDYLLLYCTLNFRWIVTVSFVFLDACFLVLIYFYIYYTQCLYAVHCNYCTLLRLVF